MVSYIDPTKPTEGKAYTSDVRLNFDITKTEIENIQISYLPLSGGIMRGPFELAYMPTKDMEAVPKKYIDDNMLNTYMLLTGGQPPPQLAGSAFDGSDINITGGLGDIQKSGGSVTLSGAKSDRYPGNIYLYGGRLAADAVADYYGGSIYINGGHSDSVTLGSGGGVGITGGQGHNTGGTVSFTGGMGSKGGIINVRGGTGLKGDGGNITISAGDASLPLMGNGGNLYLNAGDSAAFAGGSITLKPGNFGRPTAGNIEMFLSTVAPPVGNDNVVWSNNGVLNIGVGGSSGGGDYLPLTGGTITGTTRIESVVGTENVLELMSTDPDCDSLPKLKIFGEYGGGMFYTPSYGYLALQLIEDKTGVPIEGDILIFNNNNMIITAPRFTGTPSSASGSGYVYINADILKYTGGADGGTILASNSKINCASIVASMGADLGYVDSSPIILRNLPTVSQTDVNAVWNNNGALNIGAGGGGVTAPLLLDAATPNWGLYTTDLVVGSITSSSSGIKLLSNDTTKQAYAFFHASDGLHISSGTEASRSNDYMLFSSYDTSIGVMVPLNVYQDATFTRSIRMNNGQYIVGDDQTDFNGVGFGFKITGGSGNGTGSGGNITIAGGNTFAGAKLGDVILGGQLSSTGGASPTNGGNVSISPTVLGVGPGSTGNAGNIIINRGLKNPNSTGLDGEILIKNLAITARTDLDAIWNNNGVLNIGVGGSSGGGDYLPLTGGTITGNIIMGSNTAEIVGFEQLNLRAGNLTTGAAADMSIELAAPTVAGLNGGFIRVVTPNVTGVGNAGQFDVRTGESQSGLGGNISFNCGWGGMGGTFYAQAGSSTNDNVPGGAISIAAGNGDSATSVGGEVIIRSGNGDGGGGPIRIAAGNANITGGIGGDITLAPGLGYSAPNGMLKLTGLPVVAQVDATSVWNNNGALNIGAGVAIVMKAEMDAIVQSLTERIVHLEQQLGRH